MLNDRVYKFISETKRGFSSKIWIYGSYKTLGTFKNEDIAAMARLKALKLFNLLTLKQYTILKRKINKKHGYPINLDVSVNRTGKTLKLKVNLLF